MKFSALLFYATLWSVLQCMTVQAQDSTATFQNPVFNYDFPDPNVVQGKDGYFYAYATQADWRKRGLGGPYIMPILRSKNLVQWDTVGGALLQKPTWKSEGGIWAPDAAVYKGKYFLYYSFSTWGDPNPGIGVATASKPEGPFIDHGKLFLSKELDVANSIDAVFYQDKKKPYLIWGSFHGIYGVQLSKDGLKIKGAKFPIAGNAYEGSLVYKRDGWYYYFGSVGTCCEGAKSTYHVKVGRSKNFKGPYVDKEGKSLLQNGGTLLLQKNDGATGFNGPGHNADIITDKQGQTWMLYHAFDKAAPEQGRKMLLDKIEWVDGWPVMAAAQPSTTPQPVPVF